MTTLLYEIGCEELPSSAVEEALAQFPALCKEHLGAEPAELYVGPRRLAVVVEGLPDRTDPEWIAGPPLHVGEKAAEGFARKLGLDRSALVERDGVLGWEKPPQEIAATLPPRLEAILRGFSFSRSMVWDDSGLRFARPVRWTLAVLGAEPVDSPLSSGSSRGPHRGSPITITIPIADAYAETLRADGIEPSQPERRRQIVEALDALGGWTDPMGKLDEVVNLVESPLVLDGVFDERFLELPPRVVEVAMQSHQRYFPLGGSRFAFVANGGDPDLVRAGNEQVLDGRLDDAAFTFGRDLAAGIDQLEQRLGAITFFKGAGSYADKTARLTGLVRELGGDEVALAAARLCKADQASELVREFPELEGHIGAEYVRRAGRPEEVCAAIDEHYLPDAADAPLPATPAGRVLAAADRLDTLGVAFRLGHRPTGSRDPFALRRAAIGLCRLAIEADLDLAISDAEVRDFVEERLEGVLDVPVEFVRAARGADLGDLRATAALARALADVDEGTRRAVQEVYTRAVRIVGDRADEEVLNRILLREEAEQALADALDAFELTGDLPHDLAGAAELAPVVERFFEDVLVIHPDEELKANRLRLLRDLKVKVGRLGDFSQLPG